MAAVSAPSSDALRRLLPGASVRSVYQPIVELDDLTVVAYEALARGPRGSSLERPDQLFAAAIGAGLLAELDWACRAAAISGALDAGLPLSTALFVNVEPSVLRAPCPPHLQSVFEDPALR